MKTHKRTPHQEKILKAMDQVYYALIEYKIKMKSELVVMKDGVIVKIKPEDLLK